MSVTTPEAELRALRQPAPAMPVRRHHPPGRGQPQRVRGDPALRRRERRAGAPRRQPACGEPASGDLPAERGDGRPRAARRRRHGADPAPRLGLDAARRHRRAERPRARRAGRRRRSLAGAAACLEKPIAEPAGLPGMRALGAARRRRAAAGPTSASWRSPGGPRSAARSHEDLRRARALLAEAIPPGMPRPSPIAPSSSARSARCSATATSSPPPAAAAAPGGAGAAGGAARPAARRGAAGQAGGLTALGADGLGRSPRSR